MCLFPMMTLTFFTHSLICSARVRFSILAFTPLARMLGTEFFDFPVFASNGVQIGLVDLF
jgi:hypothetical protein